MLFGRLIHPGLLRALAGAGHGSQILLADGNYPMSTGRAAAASVVELNLSPGMVTVDDVLAPLLATIPIEAAAVMVPADGSTPAAHQSYRRLLGPDVPWREMQRQEFYDAARGSDLAVAVATGDTRIYANVLLTIGVRPGSGTG